MARVISCGRTHQLPAPQVTHSWRCQPPLPPIDIYPLRQKLSAIKIPARRSPMPNLSPGGLAVNSTPTLQRSLRVDAKSKYATMMSRQHKAIIQIKQEKKKPSYPSSIVPKVRSAECDRPPLFFNKHSNHRVNPHSIKNMQVFRVPSS